jgi:hypothetical protein
MHRILIAVAVAGAFALPATASAHGYRHHVRHQYDHARMWNAPVSMYRHVGPPWASPNQCFVDLGYGRYESCDR